MKRSTLILFLLLVMLFTFTSCNNAKKSNTDQIVKSAVIETFKTDALKTTSDLTQNVGETTNDTVNITQIEMGNVISHFYSKKTLNEAYNDLLSKKEFIDVKYLKGAMPNNAINYKDKTDDVDISYIFNGELNLVITLIFAGGVTTFDFSQNTDGTTMVATISAD